MATIDNNIKGSMSYQESVEIRDLLTKHYSQKLKDEVERVVSQKKLSDRDYDKLRGQD